MRLVFHDLFLPKLIALAVAYAATVWLPTDAYSNDGVTLVGDNGAALHVIDSSIKSTNLSLSADGTTVVGQNTADQAAIWTAQTGMISLGTLGGDRSWATGVSANGKVVVGISRTAEQTTGRGRNRTVIPARDEAFRWTAETGMVSLGVPPGGSWSRARGVSGDGNIVVGNFHNGSYIEPFVWTPETGMFRLGSLYDGQRTQVTEFSPISADGTTVIGQGWNDAVSSGYREGFVWTAADGMISTGPLAGSWSIPRAVSADGSFVIGRGAGHSQHFGWTRPDGIFPLSDMEVIPAEAHGVSVADNWSTVVGDFHPDGNWNQFRAFAWLAPQGDEKDGGIMLPLDHDQQFLNSGAYPISADGSRIAGAVWSDWNYPHDLTAVVWDGVNGELQFLEDKLLDVGVDSLGAGIHLADPWWGISANGEVLLGVCVDLLSGRTRVFVAVLSSDLDPGDDPGDDPPPGDDDDPAGDLAVGVSYSNTGPAGRHLDVTVTVASDEGALSSGSISATLVNVTENQSWDYSGTTGSDGSFTFRRSNAPSGTYMLIIHDVDHPDYEWDGEYDDPGHQR